MPQLTAELVAERARGALIRALQGMGINPYYSTIGRQLLEHTEDMTPLAYSYLGNQDNGIDQFQNFADAYARQMVYGGGSSGGWDLSRGGQKAAIGGFQQNAQPGTAAYDYLRQGSPEDQFNKWRGFEQVARQGQFRPLAEAGLNVERQRFEDFSNKQIADPNFMPNTGWLDYYQKRSGPGPYAGGGGGPGGGGGGGGTPPTPYAPPTGPGTTPPAGGTPPAGTPPAGTPPGTPPAGTPQTFANAAALLANYRQGQQNWGTRMMGNPSQGFSFGGVSYDPTREGAQGSQRYRNMSGQGRETARGSNFGVFMYRLQQLLAQRNAGGNAALGINAQTTDAQLAQLAAQFVRTNYVGQSAFS